jgi:hypothetical protein
MLLDIGQIDGVTFYQKLDCRPNGKVRMLRNVKGENAQAVLGYPVQPFSKRPYDLCYRGVRPDAAGHTAYLSISVSSS